MIMKVTNLFRNGRSVPNQFEIVTESGVYMQSYDRICVRLTRTGVIMSKWWCYSPTTLKYVKQFLNGHGIAASSKAEIQRLIKNGEICLVESIDLV